MRRTPGRIIVSILSLFLLFVAGCGGQQNSSDTRQDGNSTAGLTLKWPAGFSYDTSTHQLAGASGKRDREIPTYVTAITVTITGDGMSDQTLNVPLGSGEASFSVTPGLRRFDVLVQTNIGTTFTGSTSQTLVAGPNNDISIELFVNVAPAISSVDISPSSPQKGAAVTITINASDADNDTLSYTGKVTNTEGVWASWNSDSYTGVVTIGGKYTVSVMVEDTRGGVARQTATFYTQNHSPVIQSVTAGNTEPTVGEKVDLSCEATDADGDEITYSWSDGLGWNANGKTVKYTVGQEGSITIVCAVTDGDPSTGKVTKSVVLTATNPSGVPAAPTNVKAAPEDSVVTISWDSVSNATSYNIYYSTVSGQGTNGTKISGMQSPHMIIGLTNGVTYYFVVTAVNDTGESVPSTEVSAAPSASTGGAGPTNVVATAGDGQITVTWDEVSGATSYNIYKSTTQGAGTSGDKHEDVTSPHTFTGLENGTTYYMVVTAVTASGETQSSSEVSATPKASATTGTVVADFYYHNKSTPVEGVTVYICTTDPASTCTVGWSGESGNDGAYTFTDIPAGTYWLYWILPTDSIWPEKWHVKFPYFADSDSFTVTAGKTTTQTRYVPRPAVSDLAMSGSVGGNVSLTWSGHANVSSYVVTLWKYDSLGFYRSQVEQDTINGYPTGSWTSSYVLSSASEFYATVSGYNSSGILVEIDSVQKVIQ